MDLADRVAALYALPLDTFTSARNAAAKEAAQDGDKELGALLRTLPKPSSAAWLVNILVARRRDDVQQVLELSASLQEAQAGLDRAQLQALGQQRQRLLAAVARGSLDAAAGLGYDVGPAALPGVEQTLRAALADAGAAAAVLTGRLVRTLEASGWDDVDLEGAVAGPFRPLAGPSPGLEDGEDEDMPADDGAAPGLRAPKRERASARERRAAEVRVSAAREAREAAEGAATAARRSSEQLGIRREEVAASIEDLEERLAALQRERRDLESRVDTLARESADADDALLEAVEAEESAATARAELDG